jgi:DNA-binding transcriptional regulator YiaG
MEVKMDIKEFRQQTGKTQQQMADELTNFLGAEVGQGQISRWENKEIMPSGPARKMLKDYSHGLIDEF